MSDDKGKGARRGSKSKHLRRLRSELKFSKRRLSTEFSKTIKLQDWERTQAEARRAWCNSTRFKKCMAVLRGDAFNFFVIPVLLLPALAFGMTMGLLFMDSNYTAAGSKTIASLYAVNIRHLESLLGTIVRDIVIVLGLLITSSFVVLQMFAANFLPHTISLFFKNMWVLTIICFMIISVGFASLTSTVLGETLVPLIPMVLSIGFRFLVISISIPFFNFLINFLSPEALITQVTKSATNRLDVMLRTECEKGTEEKSQRNYSFSQQTMQKRGSRAQFTIEAPVAATGTSRRSLEAQSEFIDAVELVGEIGLSSLKQKDKENANYALLSLYMIACRYSRNKNKRVIPIHWFELSEAVRARPDFSSLSSSSLANIINQKTWLEWKILRSYQVLFETAVLLHAPNLAGLSAFYIRKLGSLAAENGDNHVMTLCIKFLNTFISHLLQGNHVRILTGVLNEYREMAFDFLKTSRAKRSHAHVVNNPKKESSTSLGGGFKSSSNLGSPPKSMRLGQTEQKHILLGELENNGADASSLSILAELPKFSRDSSTGYSTSSLSKSLGKRISFFQNSSSNKPWVFSSQNLLQTSSRCDSCVVKMLLHLRYYLVLCLDINSCMAAEIIAHDVGTLCAEAYRTESPKHEELLTIFLSLDDISTSPQQVSALRGIRRAQIKLATEYLSLGEENLAREIQADMDDEPLVRMRNIYREFQQEDRETFWEISFRSKNLNYLNREHKAMLQTFFTWFSNYTLADVAKDASRTSMRLASLSKLDQEDIGNLTYEGETEICTDDEVEKSENVDSEAASAKTRTETVANSRYIKNRIYRYLGITAKVGAICSLLFLLFWADHGYGEQPSAEAHSVMEHLFSQLKTSDTSRLMSAFALASVLMFVLLCVTSMIILQLVAGRYKFHPDLLSFLRDPSLYTILCLLLVSCMVSTMINMFSSPNEHGDQPRLTVMFMVTLITVEVVLVLVYVIRLFEMLQPENILRRTRDSTFRHIWTTTLLRCDQKTRSASYAMVEPIIATPGPVNRRRDSSIESELRLGNGALDSVTESEIRGKTDEVESFVYLHQFQCHEHMKRICDFGFACVHESDEGNLHAAISTLQWLVESYSKVKKRLPDTWFIVTRKLRQTSDFINFSKKRIKWVSDTRVWFEYKVFTQYLLIFEECLLMKRFEACQYISITLRRISGSLLNRGDYDAYQVLFLFFNTFLRRAISTRCHQVANHAVVQYGIALANVITKRAFSSKRWQECSLEHAWFLKYYAKTAIEMGLGTVSETIATVLGEVCSVAQSMGFPLHKQFLEYFLTLDDFEKEDMPETLVGIRRAQVKLGTEYLSRNEVALATVVARDMVQESPHRIAGVVDELLSLHRPEFWEVSEYGTPCDFLTAELKEQVIPFFELLEMEKALGSTMVPQISIIDHINNALKDEIQAYISGDIVHSVATAASKATQGWRLTHWKMGMNSLKTMKGQMLKMEKPKPIINGSCSSIVLSAEEDISNIFQLSVLETPGQFSRFRILFWKLLVPFGVTAGSMLILLLLILLVEGVESVPDAAFDILKRLWGVYEKNDSTLSLEVVFRIFSVVVMCSLIALQKSASRMVKHVWMLYRKNFWFRLTWGTNAIAILASVWCAATSVSQLRPTLALFTLLVSSACVVVIYPYFSYFFVFLDEDKMLLHVADKDIRFVKTLIESEKHLSRKERPYFSLVTLPRVARIIDSFHRITDFASSTIRSEDKPNSYNCVSAIFCLGQGYTRLKKILPKTFFSSFLKHPVTYSHSDFSRLTSTFKATIVEQRTWIEWKLLRQYLFLYQESMGRLTDVCYHIVIHTKALGECGFREGDMPVLDMCIKFLNTFLKQAIDRVEVRLSFNILFQYRKLAENIMTNEYQLGSLTSQDISDSYVVDIVGYFLHYATAAIRQGQPFLAGVIAHDISLLCILSCRRKSACHDALLDMFLGIQDTNPSARAGVRRAQVKLAAFYICSNHEVHARRVHKRLINEKPELILQAYLHLHNAQVSSGFWEINERMYNIDHMSEKNLAAVQTFLSWFSPQMLESGEELISRLKRLETSISASSPIEIANMTAPQAGGLYTTSMDSMYSGFSREIATRARRAAKGGGGGSGDDRIMSSVLGVVSKKKKGKVSPAVHPSETGEVDTNTSTVTSKRSGNKLTNLVRWSWVPMLFILPFAPLITVLASLTDSYVLEGFESPFVREYTLEDKQRAMKLLSRSAAIIFCLLLTPTLIMLQINSRQLLGIIADQYFTNRRVHSMLMFYTVANVFVLWGDFLIGSEFCMTASIMLCLSLVLLMIVVLFPYFATLFSFLDPHKVVSRMLHSALDVTVSCIKEEPGEGHVEGAQKQVSVILQQLTGFARASIQKSDKHNFANVVKILSLFMEDYLQMKGSLHESWFDATTNALRLSQDFVSLDFSQVEGLKRSKTWVESKVLRQFQTLYNTSLTHLPEGCLLISIETVKIGQRAFEIQDKETVDLVIRMFNTYIRQCINQRDVRAAYNTLHQYRQLAELLLISETKPDWSTAFAISIAKYMRYYASVAASIKLNFFVETVANDIASISETAFLLGIENFVPSDKLMVELLSMFDFLQELPAGQVAPSELLAQREPIGRACLRLTTLYMDRGDMKRAFSVAKILAKQCPPGLLKQIREKLEMTTEKDFWEINDRGSNFDYLPDHRRLKLEPIFKWLKHITREKLDEKEEEEVNKDGDMTIEDMEAMVGDSGRRKSGMKGLNAAIRAAGVMRSKLNFLRNPLKNASVKLDTPVVKPEERADEILKLIEKQDVEDLDSSWSSSRQVVGSGSNARYASTRIDAAYRVRLSRRGSSTMLTTMFSRSNILGDDASQHSNKTSSEEEDKNMNKNKVRDRVQRKSGLESWEYSIYFVPVIVGSSFFLSILPRAYEYGQENGMSSKQVFLMLTQSFFPENGSFGAIKESVVVALGLGLVTFLGCIVTVTTIVLQIVSTRYTPKVAILFLKKKRIIACLATFFVSASYGLIQGAMTAGAQVSATGFTILLILFWLSFVLLMPYIAYLLRFLNATKIFRDIGNEGVRIAVEPATHQLPLTFEQMSATAQQKLQDHLSDQQGVVLESIDQISGFTHGSLLLKDKYNAFHGVDLLCAFSTSFIVGARAQKIRSNKFKLCISETVSTDTEFISLSDGFVKEMENSVLWVQWKVLRQLLKMFEAALGDFNDAILRISRGFRHIEQTAITELDFASANLTMKFFNTILQKCTMKKNNRAGDTVLLQYRFALEFSVAALSKRRKEETPSSPQNPLDDDEGDDEDIKDRLQALFLDGMGYLKHYAQIALSIGNIWMCEHIIHDICSLAIFTRHLGAKTLHFRVLDKLASFINTVQIPNHPIKNHHNDVNHLPRGVLRALTKLAAIYIAEFDDSMNDQSSSAWRIYQLLKDLDNSHLRGIWLDFRMMGDQDFWEVTDRGTNVDGLSSFHKKELRTFLKAFKKFDFADIETTTETAQRLAGLKKKTT